jgi:hypothetical protein
MKEFVTQNIQMPWLISTFTKGNFWSVDNIKMDLREIEWDGMDWIDLPQDRDQ